MKHFNIIKIGCFWTLSTIYQLGFIIRLNTMYPSLKMPTKFEGYSNLILEWNISYDCQNPNSTISSIQQSLRFDYILTQWSTPPPTHHPPPQTQLIYSKLGRADNYPASEQGPVCTSVQSHTHQCSHSVLRFNVRTFFQTKRFWIFLSQNSKIISGKDQMDIN